MKQIILSILETLYDIQIIFISNFRQKHSLLREYTGIFCSSLSYVFLTFFWCLSFQTASLLWMIQLNAISTNKFLGGAVPYNSSEAHIEPYIAISNKNRSVAHAFKLINS